MTGGSARARYAADPDLSRGRRHTEEVAGEVRGPRNAFQRDRDRVIHSIAFRRLRHKTQVFVAPDGDHFRVRLTHSIEVAQIARTIARALGLDEDLTEAIALAHDIGHPPFGHAGEAALDEAAATWGGFEHNGHTLRVLTRLEQSYPRWDGLNLAWETLEGLAKHNGPVASPGWALAEADAGGALELRSWPSLEAQVAALADDIAYDNHDIDDGVRAGLLDLDALDDLGLVADTRRAVERRFPGLPVSKLLPELVRTQIGRMVEDLLRETRRRLADVDPADVDAVRAAGRPLIGFSAPMAEAERVLKRAMYARLYHHPQQIAVAQSARGVIARLSSAYLADPSLLPETWRERMPAEAPWRQRHVVDFIAGMTDRYAVARHREVVGPVEMPDGL